MESIYFPYSCNGLSELCSLLGSLDTICAPTRLFQSPWMHRVPELNTQLIDFGEKYRIELEVKEYY